LSASGRHGVLTLDGIAYLLPHFARRRPAFLDGAQFRGQVRILDAAAVTADSGTNGVWYARDLRFRPGMAGSVAGTLATMGCGVPYAIVAKFAPPRPASGGVGGRRRDKDERHGRARDHRQVPAPVGRSAAGRAGAEQPGPGLRDVEQRVQAGDPKIDAAQQLPDLPYASIAELIGLRGIRVEEPEGVGPAWAEMLAADRPVVLDMVTDSNVPPLPPRMTLKQARTFAHALFTGEPDTTSMLVNTAREMVGTLLPGGAKG